MELEKLIPQREPFLFVDEIDEIEPGIYGAGRKKIREEEYFFAGHFPGNPVFPGVLMIEATGQLANAVVRTLPEYADGHLYYSKMSRVKFSGDAVPGDELQLKVQVTDQIDDIFFCKVFVKREGKELLRADVVYNVVK